MRRTRKRMRLRMVIRSQLLGALTTTLLETRMSSCPKNDFNVTSLTSRDQLLKLNKRKSEKNIKKGKKMSHNKKIIPLFHPSIHLTTFFFSSSCHCTIDSLIDLRLQNITNLRILLLVLSCLGLEHVSSLNPFSSLFLTLTFNHLDLNRQVTGTLVGLSCLHSLGL